MIVLDANILIRAALGRQALWLLETYGGHGIRFFAPDVAFTDAQKYLPPLLIKRGKPLAGLPATIESLRKMIESIGRDLYLPFEAEARQCLTGRGEDDWPVLASALGLAFAIWTEDSDFLGTGVAVWTTSRIEIFLEARIRELESSTIDEF
jgi:predicted nucleic acid-binding protein